uniref:GTP binding protein 6 (putative) n=1 Tax=Hippocampus comes TaxID=109280 RepID=A0A3Q2XY60_HIPCM
MYSLHIKNTENKYTSSYSDHLRNQLTVQLKKNYVCLSGFTQQEDDIDEDEDSMEEEEEADELFRELQPATALPEGPHRLFVVHPDVKWGSRKQHLTTGEWTVNLTVFTNLRARGFCSQAKAMSDLKIMLLHHPSAKVLYRSKGRCNHVNNKKNMNIFFPGRSRLKNEFLNLDQQGGGARYIGGSGETQQEVQQRLLREREMKIRAALEKLSRKRRLLRTRRKHKEFPIVSVLGYTNCGKTTLIKALTGDAGLHPQDRLFATLDVTVHAGQLPGRVTVLYVDTIGFLSHLPHQLIDSFAATLEDIKHSDVLIHVRDVSHPENVNQKANVLNVLRNLRVPDALLSSMIEVHNKIDLIDNYESTEDDSLAISALNGRGLEALKTAVERRVLAATGKRLVSLKVDLSTPQLSWLYKEAAVQDVSVDADEGSAVVKVVIGNAAYGRYRKMFG